LLTHEP
jgi:hypothetical protein